MQQHEKTDKLKKEKAQHRFYAAYINMCDCHQAPLANRMTYEEYCAKFDSLLRAK